MSAFVRDLNEFKMSEGPDIFEERHQACAELLAWRAATAGTDCQSRPAPF
jgi:hypothetical protein